MNIIHDTSEMSSGKSTGGTNLYDFSSGNPYVGQDPYASLSWWNKFTDFLGFTNHAGSAYSQWFNAARQWESERALQLEEREYYSEREVAARQRLAGLNPDLTGLPSSDNAGTPPQNSYTPYDANRGPLNFGTFLQNLSGIVSSAFGIAQGVISISDSRYQMDIDNFLKMSDVAADRQAGSIANEILNGLGNAYLSGNKSDIMSSINDYISSGRIHLSADNVGLPRPRTRSSARWIEEQLDRMINSASFKESVYNKIAAASDAKKNALESVSASNAYEALAAEENRTIADVLSDFSVAQLKIQREYQNFLRKNYKYQADMYGSLDPSVAAGAFNAQNFYSNEYLSALDPEARAGAENMSFMYEGQQKKFQKFTDDAFETLLDVLDSNKNAKGETRIFANIMKFFAVQMYMNFKAVMSAPATLANSAPAMMGLTGIPAPSFR